MPDPVSAAWALSGPCKWGSGQNQRLHRIFYLTFARVEVILQALKSVYSGIARHTQWNVGVLGGLHGAR